MKFPFKKKVLLIVCILFFMLFYGIAFGNKNITVGIMITFAAFMNLGNDLSYKPKLSFIKILALLLILGIVAYLNNPISLFGCILTFIVVFGTTMTSYHLFGSNVYLPYLMCYFIMMCIPISLEDLSVRLLSLVFGAVFIVGLNLLVNRDKAYKLSKETIESLFDEINKAVDLKLEGKVVSQENFKTAKGFYSSIYSRFEYKVFPSPVHESILTVVKSFQSIGKIIADFDLSENELKYIKKILRDIEEIDASDIFDGIEIENKPMNIVLLNFEYIVDEINNVDLSQKTILPDKKFIKPLIIPLIKSTFSFRLVKFTFAFKMAFILTLWEVLTLIFNLPVTKWLYLATIPLMLPYIDDVSYTAKSRLKGTVVGLFIATIIMISMPYSPLSSNMSVLIILVVCMVGIVYYMGNKFMMPIFSTILSIISSLMYITLDSAIELKLLWVFIAIVVASVFNHLFLPFSVEKESKNNLNALYKLNVRCIDLIKENSNSADSSSKKTSLLVVSNILAANIEVNPQNEEIYNLQDEITDISYFIITYMNKNKLSNDFKENLNDIMDNGSDVNDNLNNKDKVILYSISFLMKLFNKEMELMN